MNVGTVFPGWPTQFAPSGGARCSECGMRKAPMTAEDLQAFPAPLTPKECRIIVLLCGGMTNKEIAARLETTEQVQV